ncbi:MAG: tetratricopeptide repeat protein [Saprospiraceae bacterium]|nr:tetratricopeptide repeat protein [Saprospiraceae bacterium]
MKYNSDHDHSLIVLVNEFETMSQEGNVSFLEEQDFAKLINYYEKEFLFEKAIEVADYALNQYGFSADFHIRKAQLFLATRKSEQAMSILDKAEVFAPAELEIHILRAKIYCAQAHFSEALRLLQRTKANSNDEDLSDIYLCEAQVHECMKEYDLMFDSLKKSLIFDPENEEALERVWVCTELTKKYKESIKFHKKIIDERPYSFLAWYNLGHAYSCKGDYEKAIEAYEYSIIINEEFELGYRECADLCFQTCQYNKALTLYCDAVDLFGPDSDLLANIGECYLQLNNYKSAQEHFNKASKLDPYNDEVYFYLGLCHAHEDRWLSAINAYFKAIEIEDRREEYFCNLAIAFSKVGEFAKAHYYFLKATEIGPEQSSIWKDHAAFLLQIREIDKAMEVLEEAEYHAVGPELLYSRAACYFSLKQKKKGLEQLRKALMDDISLHQLIFDILPSLKDDLKVNQLIDYYLKETTL